ncbi:hypothetical protein J3A83DRAFT_4194302 [Scleroderma citrinum]
MPSQPPSILSFTQAMVLSKEELWNKLQCMYQQNHVLFSSNQMLTAEFQAAKGHCTLAQCALAQSWLELDNIKKKQPCTSVKLQSRFVMLPELKEDFEKVEKDWQEEERVTAEKQAKKKADDDIL